jgi:hypothetical protein
VSVMMRSDRELAQAAVPLFHPARLGELPEGVLPAEPPETGVPDAAEGGHRLIVHSRTVDVDQASVDLPRYLHGERDVL